MFTGRQVGGILKDRAATVGLEARVQAESFKEMNIQTNEAENGFMQDMYCEIASGFDAQKVTVDFNKSNFA